MTNEEEMTFRDDREKNNKQEGKDEDRNDSGILTQWEMDIFSMKNQHKCIKSSH